MASNGNDVLVAWWRGDRATGGDVVAARVPVNALSSLDSAAGHPFVLGQFASDLGATRTSAATDGRRYVVVWRVQTSAGDHDVAGAVLDSDGTVTPLTIAATSADERDPEVVYVGGGAFLAGYEKTVGIERRIAGRSITFGRHHATR